jgi:hypothetical protein
MERRSATVGQKLNATLIQRRYSTILHENRS